MVGHRAYHLANQLVRLGLLKEHEREIFIEELQMANTNTDIIADVLTRALPLVQAGQNPPAPTDSVLLGAAATAFTALQTQVNTTTTSTLTPTNSPTPAT